MTQLDVRPLSRAVGAEILGINLLDPVSDAQIAEIRQIWLQHGVVFFREQPLESGAFQAFAQRFGEIIEYPFVKGLPDFPLIVPVLKLPHEKHNFGGVWHTDTTYLQEPPMATMLIARELLQQDISWIQLNPVSKILCFVVDTFSDPLSSVIKPISFIFTCIIKFV